MGCMSFTLNIKAGPEEGKKIRNILAYKKMDKKQEQLCL